MVAHLPEVDSEVVVLAAASAEAALAVAVHPEAGRRPKIESDSRFLPEILWDL